MRLRSARALRKRLTVAEEHLWGELRELRRQGYHFRKQAPIDGYIVEFACLSQRVVDEVDGAQHFEPGHQVKDSNRDAHLRSIGFTVVRCTNADVMENRDGVILEILAALGAVVTGLRHGASSIPPPLPLPARGRGTIEATELRTIAIASSGATASLRKRVAKTRPHHEIHALLAEGTSRDERCARRDQGEA